MKKLFQSVLSACYILAGLAAFTPAHGQNIEWSRSESNNYTFNPYFLSYPVAASANGEAVICGMKNLNMNPGFGSFGDVMVRKYSATGQLLFDKIFYGNGSFTGAAIGPQGHIALVGEMYDSLVLDANHRLDVPFQHRTHFIALLDASGNPLWLKNLSDNNQFTADVRSATFDQAGNLYVGYDDFTSSYITKFDMAGNALMTILQFGVARVTSVDVDAAGNIYTAGSCGTLSSAFAGHAMPDTLDYSIYVAKYNAAGTFQWAHFMEHITCGPAFVKAVTNGDVYLAGDYVERTRFGNIQLSLPAQHFNDGFLAKLNSAGVFQWAKGTPDLDTWGNSFFPGQFSPLAVDAAGNAFVAGKTSGNITWGPGIQTSSNGQEDILVLKYDSQGNILWAKPAGGIGNDEAHSIAVTPTGESFITGIIQNTVTLGNQTHNHSGTGYPFIAKLSSTVLNAPAHVAANNLRVYPNPAGNQLSVELPEQPKAALLRIINTLGQEFKQQQVTEENRLDLDISSLAAGTYMLLLQTEHQQTSTLFIKQ